MASQPQEPASRTAFASQTDDVVPSRHIGATQTRMTRAFQCPPTTRHSVRVLRAEVQVYFQVSPVYSTRVLGGNSRVSKMFRASPSVTFSFSTTAGHRRPRRPHDCSGLAVGRRCLFFAGRSPCLALPEKSAPHRSSEQRSQGSEQAPTHKRSREDSRPFASPLVFGAKAEESRSEQRPGK